MGAGLESPELDVYLQNGDIVQQLAPLQPLQVEGGVTLLRMRIPVLFIQGGGA